MKKKVEFLILSSLFVLWGGISLKYKQDFNALFVYSAVQYLFSGALFFGTLYYLIPALMNKAYKKFLAETFLLLLSTLLITIILNSSIQLQDGTFKDSISFAGLFEPAVVFGELSMIGAFFLLGMFYGYFRHLFISGKTRVLKRILVYSGGALVLLVLGFGIKYQIDISYQGNEQVRFLDQEYSSLEEILSLPQFENKVVYVDLWHSGCGPCLNDFMRGPEFKKALKGKAIEFLYLGRETSHPNSKQRWKNVIKKFNLQGWHFYMSKEFDRKNWEMILANQKEEVRAAYPRYILVGQKGQVVNYNAHGPGEKVLALQQINDLFDQPLANSKEVPAGGQMQ